MSRSKQLVIVGIAVLAAGAWYAFRPERLFINQRVNESFPSAAVAAASADPALIASGQFHTVAHKSTGKASIYRLPDGRRVLRFSEFETSNGPDVQVYLGIAGDATDSDTVTKAGFYSLGQIRATSAIRTTTSPPRWICRGTSPSRSGAGASASISAPRRSRRSNRDQRRRWRAHPSAVRMPPCLSTS